MDHALPVRRGERGGDLVEDPGDLGEGQRAALEGSFEAAAAHEAHDQAGPAGVAPVVIERHDVQMLEMGDQLRLGLESPDEVGLVRVLEAG